MGHRVRKQEAKQAVLGQLDLLVEDRHPQNQTLMARFVRCRDYQAATGLLHEALGAMGRWRNGTALAPPPGWLPPLT